MSQIKATFRPANLKDPQDSRDIIELLDSYARDPMGGEEGLSDFVKENLIASLLARSQICHVFLALVDNKAVGLAICFEGFSTFYCKPLLNVHDFTIVPPMRNHGLGKQFMQYVADYAQTELGCCKVTLEVLEGNIIAQKAYSAVGFEAYTLSESTGRALMWQKKL